MGERDFHSKSAHTCFNILSFYAHTTRTENVVTMILTEMWMLYSTSLLRSTTQSTKKITNKQISFHCVGLKSQQHHRLLDVTTCFFRRWSDPNAPRPAVQHVRPRRGELRSVRPRCLVVQRLPVVQPQRTVGQQRAYVPGNQLVPVGVRYGDIRNEDTPCRLELDS